MLSSTSDSRLIKNSISCEYNEAKQQKENKTTKPINAKLKTIRIFISSTFRDFHNERNILVTKVFPRLREWCASHGLHLVECDLRWGIPTDTTREQTILTCFEEIEKGRNECNDMNFFLGLIGNRYGWIPGYDEITDKIRNKYKWIDGSSVTLMEFMHGMIRTLTPNGLIMIRLPDFLEQLPENLKPDFVETDAVTEMNLKMFKEFLNENFREKNLLQFYRVGYEGVVYDNFIDKERVLLIHMEEFGDAIANHFIKCIKENLLPFLKSPKIDDNIDEVHEFMVECLAGQNTIPHKTYRILYETLKHISSNNAGTPNKIFLLSGEAGMGKSTILAFCAKELQKLENCASFFHSFSCTSNSMFNSTVCERLYRFLSVNDMTANKTFTEKTSTISSIFQTGPKRTDKDVFYIFLDGIDEMSYNEKLLWIPPTTSNRIVIVISSLINQNSDSFYSKLKSSDKSIHEITIRPMNKLQLCNMVTLYLDEFGKKLDYSQTESLLKFENSRNPLWLISACEELRIHGDYASLTKFISILPPTICELNEMVIKRLIKLDKSNLVKMFLQLLVVSKSGLWESLGKEILGTVSEKTTPINQLTWNEIICQLKGFLLIQAIPLPLIKLRHRVMKESVERELHMDDKFRSLLHHKLSLFFENLLEKSCDLFLSDYLYHLVKSDSRNRLLNFMRSKPSWTVVRQTFVRSQIMMSMRCANKVANLPQQQNSELMMCSVCAHKSNDLSLHTINKYSCLFCGTVIFNKSEAIKLFPCQFHKAPSVQIVKCNLCLMTISGIQGEALKCCSSCKAQSLPEACGVIVKEDDILFHQQMAFSKKVHRIDSLI